MTDAPRISRRAALKRLAAAGLAAPFVFRAHAGAAPSETLRHASFGANGMALSDIRSLTASKNLQLVAVAEVDLNRAADVKKQFPNVKVYQDWRELLDKEKGLDSANISTPDHMHAPITMRCMHQGLHVYTQKPLTQTIYEARQLTKVARDKKLVTQMGIQIHSHEVHRTVVAIIQEGLIGKVKEVHSWSGKQWGDRSPRPDRTDPIPAGFNWDFWLGVAAERPFIGGGYYHPGNWRKRLDFGTGTFGDMGCHILDPVFASLALTAPTSVRSDGDAPNADNWGLDVQVRYVFPGTKYTAETLTLHWYNGNKRPPEEVKKLIGRDFNDQGSVYIGTDGVLYSPYIAAPVLLPAERFVGRKVPKLGGQNHYLQFVEACRGNGKTSAPFDYSGPLTEAVLLGCLSTRFPQTTLDWNAAKLAVTNVKEANRFVRRQYRKGWEVEGL
ncbi:MAG TPA: Gfo/Idh/MocA family oxidoreductase [Gemmataceae bacterium]|nr:Gfo/Idh/MocA family oxidoreductase [Gemmataceae bacterium]